MNKISKIFFALVLVGGLLSSLGLLQAQDLRVKKFSLSELKSFSPKLEPYKLARGVAYLKENTYGRASFLVLAESVGRYVEGVLQSGQTPLLLQASLKDQQLRYDQVIPLDFSKVKIDRSFNILPGALALAPKGMGWVLDAKQPRLYYFDVESGAVKQVYFLNKELSAFRKLGLTRKSHLRGLTVSPAEYLFSILVPVSNSRHALKSNLLVRFHPTKSEFAIYALEQDEFETWSYKGMQAVNDDSILLLRTRERASKGLQRELVIATLNKHLSSSFKFSADSSLNQNSLANLQPLPVSQVLSIPQTLLGHDTAGLTFFGDTSTVALVDNSLSSDSKLVLLDLPEPAAQSSVFSRFLLIITLALFLAFFYFVIRLLLSGFLTNRNKQ
jgi:hypothetical protein